MIISERSREGNKLTMMESAGKGPFGFRSKVIRTTTACGEGHLKSALFILLSQAQRQLRVGLFTFIVGNI